MAATSACRWRREIQRPPAPAQSSQLATPTHFPGKPFDAAAQVLPRPDAPSAVLRDEGIKSSFISKEHADTFRLEPHPAPMFDQAFRNIDDILWKEAGCTTELDYTEQTSWLLFLKYLDGL